jgi:hypothetical protein
MTADVLPQVVGLMSCFKIGGRGLELEGVAVARHRLQYLIAALHL